MSTATPPPPLSNPVGTALVPRGILSPFLFLRYSNLHRAPPFSLSGTALESIARAPFS